MIVQKNESFSKSQLQSIKTNLSEQKQQETQSAAQEIRSPPKQRMMDLLSEKGSSKWLLVLPIRDQGFNSNKGEFRDAPSLRYGWQMKKLPINVSVEKLFRQILLL